MKTQKKVFSKISEIKKPEQVELSSEKVGLTLVGNARKIVGTIYNEEKELAKIAKEIDSLKSKAQNKIQILTNLSGNLKDATKRIQKAEQELGSGDMGDRFLDLQEDIEHRIFFCHNFI